MTFYEHNKFCSRAKNPPPSLITACDIDKKTRLGYFDDAWVVWR